MNVVLRIVVMLAVLNFAYPMSLSGQKDKPGNDKEKTSSGKALPAGAWGGPHIIMEVTAEGATVTYDCAVGTIDEPITYDDTGRFQVVGTYTPQRGGPVRSDEMPERNPAVYGGQLTGKTLRLTVTLPKKKETAGTFVLKYGDVPELTRCM